MSASEFRFPVNYNFPPFYTRQPTEATWQNQVAQWSEFIQSYCRHHRIFRIDLREATVPGASELFENSRIKRRLSFETLQEIIDEMVQQGAADWEGGNKGPKTHAVIYWRKPDDWANLILQWVTDTGNNNNILTVHEIAHGELVEDQPFYQLDGLILDKALHILSKRGVAQLFKGSGDDESMGVKFFAP